MAKKNKSRYETWDEVAVALRDMRDIALRRKKAEIQMNNAITSIKAPYEEQDKAEAKVYEELAEQVKLFTQSHKSAFVDRKTREFAFGKVGFRKTTEIVTRNVKTIIEAAKQHAMTDIIKVTEKLDKTAMEQYNDEALAAIGAKRRESEKYFCDLNIEELEG
nr:MAG TPA: hypothetical protein [Caudoviricetes sp.]